LIDRHIPCIVKFTSGSYIVEKMWRILVIKNGTYDTDVVDIIQSIDHTIDVDVMLSINLTEKLSIEAINKYIGIIILGGDQSLTNRHDADYPYKYLNNLISYTKHWIKNNVYVLGICLGAQICGEAIGCHTIKMINPVLGYDHQIDVITQNKTIKNELLKNEIHNRLKYVLCCHNDCVDCTDCDNDAHMLEVVATHHGVPYMFKINNTVYGVQFHPEITPRIFDALSDHYPFDQSDKEFMINNSKEIISTTFFFIKNWLDMLNIAYNLLIPSKGI
jgi:GMP synthase-like glutamine amidotransferase